MKMSENKSQDYLYNFLYGLFTRYKLFIAMWFFLFFLIVFFAYLITPRWYGTSMILVETHPKHQLALFSGLASPTREITQANFARNFILFLKGREVAETIVKEYSLDERLKNRKENPSSLRDKIKKKMANVLINTPISGLQSLGLLRKSEPNYYEKAIDEFVDDWLDVKVVEGTQVVSLTVKGETPALAGDISKRMVELLQERSSSMSNIELKKAYANAVIELEKVESEYEDAAEKLKQFKEDNKNVLFTEEETLLLKQINDLEKEYLSLNHELQSMETQANQIRTKMRTQPPYYVRSRVIADNELVRNLRNELAEKKVELSKIRIGKTSEHPDVRSKINEIEEIKSILSEEDAKVILSETQSFESQQELVEQLTNLEIAIEAAKTKRKATGTSLNELNARMGLFPSKEVELAGLTNEKEIKEYLYRTLRTKSEELEILANANVGEVSFRILDRPFLPGDKKPDWPKMVIVIPLGFIVSLGFSLITVFFLDYMDDGLRSVQEIEEMSSILGKVPYHKRVDLL